MDWVNGFIIPLVEVVIIGGCILTVCGIIGKAIYNAWTKQTKFFFRYKILRKKYADEMVALCMENIDKGIGWYDTKKMLLLEGKLNQDKIYETMYVYDIILNQMKGGRKKHE